jgi:hypothetical protein
MGCNDRIWVPSMVNTGELHDQLNKAKDQPTKKFWRREKTKTAEKGPSGPLLLLWSIFQALPCLNNCSFCGVGEEYLRPCLGQVIIRSDSSLYHWSLVTISCVQWICIAVYSILYTLYTTSPLRAALRGECSPHHMQCIPFTLLVNHFYSQ